MYFLNMETCNTYFILEVFMHSFETLRGSLQVVIDHIFRGSSCFAFNLYVGLYMPCIKGEYKCQNT